MPRWRSWSRMERGGEGALLTIWRRTPASPSAPRSGRAGGAGREAVEVAADLDALVAGGLQDERKVAQLGQVQQVGEGILAEEPFADVPVAVGLAAGGDLGVVGVDHEEVLESDDLVELGHDVPGH